MSSLPWFVSPTNTPLSLPPTKPAQDIQTPLPPPQDLVDLDYLRGRILSLQTAFPEPYWNHAMAVKVRAPLHWPGLAIARPPLAWPLLAWPPLA